MLANFTLKFSSMIHKICIRSSSRKLYTQFLSSIKNSLAVWRGFLKKTHKHSFPTLVAALSVLKISALIFGTCKYNLMEKIYLEIKIYWIILNYIVRIKAQICHFVETRGLPFDGHYGYIFLWYIYENFRANFANI